MTRAPRRRWRGRVGGLLLVGVLAVGAVLSSAAAGTARMAARKPGMSAWLPFWGDVEGAYRDALAHAGQLRTVSPFWYETTSERAVAARPGPARSGRTSSRGCTGPGSRWCRR
ncbi:hypothetical protein [Streptomyces sp. NPDC059122]|uniref:hypothetical protein n=1 Tax=unclassified Streptomyces TaxID=2593676 RepID=UPI0036982290